MFDLIIFIYNITEVLCSLGLRSLFVVHELADMHMHTFTCTRYLGAQVSASQLWPAGTQEHSQP